MTHTPHPAPLFILGAPRSFTSIVCGVIGQHPQCYGLPEMNLFVADTMQEIWEQMLGVRQIQLHGVLRAVAQLYAGEQSINSIDMARRWMFPRLSLTTAELYYELCGKISPLRVVDKSPIYTVSLDNLRRIEAAFPDACYLHLSRHPRAQGKSILAVADGLMAILSNSVDYSTEPATVDPQIAWLRIQTNIIEFLKDVPPNRQMHLRGEELINHRETNLVQICQWLGIADDAAALAAMQRPELSPFACLGPIGAHLGNDINFLRSPALRDGRIAHSILDGPLDWRADGKGFNKDVTALAADLGYD